jgi:hypothetical protein
VITLIQSAEHSYLGLLQADNVRVFMLEKRSTTLKGKIISVFSVVSRSQTIISFTEYNVNMSPNNVSSNEESGMFLPYIYVPCRVVAPDPVVDP